jgi:hypothetical protein
MLINNKNQVIVSSLLGLGIVGFAGAVALPFNDQIEYRIGNRIESRPAWLVPAKAEFRSLERGFGGIKILLSLLATGGCVTVMLIAREEAEQEPIRQRIKEYKNKAFEFDFAAESAFLMAQTQQRYKKLLEADEVALEGEIESAYMQSLGIDPSQEQALLTGTATLDSVANPGDKVESTTTAAIEPDQTTSPKMPVLTNYPSVLIYGAPGSGKTTFAEQEVKRRLEAGHKVIVCDPHAAYGAWVGCEVVGGGMDYAAIDAKLEWFANEVRRRYKRIESEPNPSFQPLTLVCDEFTNWAGRCSAAGEFFQSALSDIRKAKMFGLIVSHTRTMAGLANAAGMAKLRDEALLEVELLGQQCPKTGNAIPRYEAVVKLPGMPLNKRFILQVPKLTEPKNHQPTKQDSAYLDPIARLEQIYKLECDLSKPETESETVSDDFQAVKQPHSSDSDDSDAVYFTSFKLDRNKAIELILKLKNEMKHTQTEIIWMLWNARPGKTKAYETAVSEYKELLAEGEENNAN